MVCTYNDPEYCLATLPQPKNAYLSSFYLLQGLKKYYLALAMFNRIITQPSPYWSLGVDCSYVTQSHQTENLQCSECLSWCVMLEKAGVCVSVVPSVVQHELDIHGCLPLCG